MLYLLCNRIPQFCIKKNSDCFGFSLIFHYFEQIPKKVKIIINTYGNSNNRKGPDH
jgi:hypothetical protein